MLEPLSLGVRWKAVLSGVWTTAMSWIQTEDLLVLDKSESSRRAMDEDVAVVVEKALTMVGSKGGVARVALSLRCRAVLAAFPWWGW